MNENLNIDSTTLFRSIHKERYARQELIKKIEEETGRTLIVYVANLSHPGGIISRDDIAPFGDLLEGKENIDLDLLLQSPGGDIDKAEKIVYMCRNRARGFRVIVAFGDASRARERKERSHSDSFSRRFHHHGLHIGAWTD